MNNFVNVFSLKDKGRTKQLTIDLDSIESICYNVKKINDDYHKMIIGMKSGKKISLKVKYPQEVKEILLGGMDGSKGGFEAKF